MFDELGAVLRAIHRLQRLVQAMGAEVPLVNMYPPKLGLSILLLLWRLQLCLFVCLIKALFYSQEP